MLAQIPVILSELFLDGMDVQQVRMLLSELKLMMHLGCHINILSLLGVISVHLDKGALFAILEYCELGSLRQYLRQYGRQLVARKGPDSVQVNHLLLGVGKAKTCLVQDDSGISTDKSIPAIGEGYIRPCEVVENENPMEMDLLSYCYQIAAGMSFLASKNVNR